MKALLSWKSCFWQFCVQDTYTCVLARNNKVKGKASVFVMPNLIIMFVRQAAGWVFLLQISPISRWNSPQPRSQVSHLTAPWGEEERHLKCYNVAKRFHSTSILFLTTWHQAPPPPPQEHVCSKERSRDRKLKENDNKTCLFSFFEYKSSLSATTAKWCFVCQNRSLQKTEYWKVSFNFSFKFMFWKIP